MRHAHPRSPLAATRRAVERIESLLDTMIYLGESRSPALNTRGINALSPSLLNARRANAAALASTDALLAQLYQ
jgi:hypothetical protein